MIGETPRTLSIALELAMRGQQSVDATLVLAGPRSETRISAASELSAEMEARFHEWYSFLETLYEIDKGHVKYWRRDYKQKESEFTNLIAALTLPRPLGERLREAVSVADGIVILAIRTNDDRLDRLPLELLGNYCPPPAEVVVWRCREGSISRRPELRFLLVRAAPMNLPPPNSEADVKQIIDHVTQRAEPEVGSAPLLNSTYEDFLTTSRDVQPGVVHLALHGVTTGLIFKLGDGDEERSFDILARYLAGLPSVVSVVSPGCFTARPQLYDQDEEICFTKQLVDLGIPSAIGMASKFTPRAASAFSLSLYTHLAAAQSIVEAYAEAVLTVRRMRTYDRLLWSVPVLYGNGKIIPFPNKEYLDLLRDVEGMVQAVDELRRDLVALPALQPGKREAQGGAIPLRLMSVRDTVAGLLTAPVPGRRNVWHWRRELEARCEWLDSQTSAVMACIARLRAGEKAAENQLAQTAPLLASTLQQVEELVTDQYPIAAGG